VRRGVDLAREAHDGRAVARASQGHVQVALGEPAARAQRPGEPCADVAALDKRAAVQVAVAVEVVERRDERAGVDLGVDA
jgi:hypothetical protein